MAAVEATAVDDQLVGMLVELARAEGLQLTGEGGLLQFSALLAHLNAKLRVRSGTAVAGGGLDGAS